MYRLHLAVAICVLLIIGSVASCSAQATEQPNGITVTGNAEVIAKPDIAFVSGGVSMEDKDAGQAARENARTTDAVINALARSGITRTDIETQQYSVQPIYDYKKSPQVTIGYRVSNTVKVTVRDIVKVGSIIDKAVGAGANNVQNVQFDLKDRTNAARKALAEALQDAHAKAKLIAETAGVSLGPIIAVTESGHTPPRPLELGMAKSATASTIILPSDIETRASVRAVYMILHH